MRRLGQKDFEALSERGLCGVCRGDDGAAKPARPSAEQDGQRAAGHLEHPAIWTKSPPKSAVALDRGHR